MAHIDNDPVADLTKLATPLATAVAAAAVEKVFSDALFPLVTKAAAQATANQRVARQAIADAVTATEEAEIVAKGVAADIEALREDIHQRIETTLPMGAAIINSRRS